MKKIFKNDSLTGIIFFLAIFVWSLFTIIIAGRIVEKQVEERVEQRLAEYEMVQHIEEE